MSWLAAATQPVKLIAGAELLNLTARFESQEPAAWHRSGLFQLIQNFSNYIKTDWQRWIGSIADQPFEFSSDNSGWSGFEADRPY